MEVKEQDSKKKLKEPKYVLSEKKWYKNAWMWVSFVFIFLTIFVFIGAMGMSEEENNLKTQVISLKNKNKKLKKSNDAMTKAINTFLGKDSSSNKSSNDSKNSSDNLLKEKFGEILEFKVGENSKVEVTVNSAKRVNSDDSTVEYLGEKGYVEYVALTYTVKCTKGEVDTYYFRNTNFSVTGADGVIANGSSINSGPVIPNTLKEGQSFEFVYGYGLKKESPTLQVTLKNGQWTGNITQ